MKFLSGVKQTKFSHNSASSRTCPIRRNPRRQWYTKYLLRRKWKRGDLLHKRRDNCKITQSWIQAPAMDSHSCWECNELQLRSRCLQVPYRVNIIVSWNTTVWNNTRATLSYACSILTLRRTEQHQYFYRVSFSMQLMKHAVSAAIRIGSSSVAGSSWCEETRR